MDFLDGSTTGTDSSSIKWGGFNDAAVSVLCSVDEEGGSISNGVALVQLVVKGMTLTSNSRSSSEDDDDTVGVGGVGTEGSD